MDKYRPVGQQGSTFGPRNRRGTPDRFAEYSKRNYQTLTSSAFKVTPLPDVEVFKGHQGYRRTPGFRIVAPSTVSRVPRPVSDSEVPAGNYPPSDGYPPIRHTRSAGSMHGSMISSTSTRSFGSRDQSGASTPSRSNRSPSRGFRSGSPAYSTTSSVLSRAATAERELSSLQEEKPAVPLAAGEPEGPAAEGSKGEAEVTAPAPSADVIQALPPLVTSEDDAPFVERR